MEKHELDSRIAQITKSILSYARVRTANQFEAEDLAQDIILELYRSAANLRNDEAFYGFMWGVAGNVYRQWCKKRAARSQREVHDELSIGLTGTDENFPGCDDEEDQQLSLLRRELALLSAKYRRVTILYYLENRSCSEISDALSISESMVKYLLFKSRQIIKEGMSMERNYGQQSYDPKGLSFRYWGKGPNQYDRLFKSRISQNILFACYNDKLTAEEISLEIGVALPYMEDKLEELCEYDLIKRDGCRYFTNIVLFTREFSDEVSQKTAALRESIAHILEQTCEEQETAIRGLGFSGSDMNRSAYCWQICCMLLRKAVLEDLESRIAFTYPVDKFGTECFLWCVEDDARSETKSQMGFGQCSLENAAGDRMEFMDFPVNGEMIHHYAYNRQNIINILLDIAQGQTGNFSENDLADAAEMVRKGYVCADTGSLSLNAPVFTAEQYQALQNLLEVPAARITDEAEKLLNTVTRILKNHMPAHLKKQAASYAYLRLHDDAVSAPMGILLERKFLRPYVGEGMLPTTFAVLK